MKIFCVGRNYADHAKELNNAVPEEPVIFMKPDTALIKNNSPFYYPSFSKEIHYEVELVIKISKNGKHIEQAFAHKYYKEITIGIDFTARDEQQRLKSKGLPWELAKGFDGSAPIGNFIPFGKIDSFYLKKNQEQVQLGNPKDMLFSIDQIISFISKRFTLRIGDLIFTGTPTGVGEVKIGDQLEAGLNNQSLLRVSIK